MRRISLFAILLCLLSVTVAHAEDLFDIKPMADGVYAAIAKPAYKVNCNAAIILLGDSVLVVDTHSKPSAARALIEQIKKLTDKPVHYVVNTHFHWDHYQGNQAYPSSWPAGVEIISSQATRENIEHRGIPRVKYEIATMPREIEKLKSDLAAATDRFHHARRVDQRDRECHGHVHREVARVQRAYRTRKERTCRIQHDGGGDEQAEPAEQVARARVHAVEPQP